MARPWSSPIKVLQGYGVPVAIPHPVYGHVRLPKSRMDTLCSAGLQPGSLRFQRLFPGTEIHQGAKSRNTAAIAGRRRTGGPSKASRLSGHRWFCTRGRGRCRGISSLRTLKVVLPRRCVQASAPRSAVYGRDMGPCLSFPWLSRVHRIPVAPASMYPVSPESLNKMA